MAQTFLLVSYQVWMWSTSIFWGGIHNCTGTGHQNLELPMQMTRAFSMLQWQCVFVCACTRWLECNQQLNSSCCSWGVPSDSSPVNCIPSPIHVNSLYLCELWLMRRALREAENPSLTDCLKLVPTMNKVGASGGHFVNEYIESYGRTYVCHTQTRLLYVLLIHGQYCSYIHTNRVYLLHFICVHALMDVLSMYGVCKTSVSWPRTLCMRHPWTNPWVMHVIIFNVLYVYSHAPVRASGCYLHIARKDVNKVGASFALKKTGASR